jgi:DNA-binding NarL/FixJ family response regulator
VDRVPVPSHVEHDVGFRVGATDEHITFAGNFERCGLVRDDAGEQRRETRLAHAGAATPARADMVLTLIRRGHTNADIAAALFVGEATVETHINRIFSKVGVRDRTQAVILAYETGLVQLGEHAT